MTNPDEMRPPNATTRAGIWSWDASQLKLTVTESEVGSIPELVGTWTLDELARQFNGLSASQLSNALQVSEPDSVMDQKLDLADGRQVWMIGALDGVGAGRGLFLSMTGQASVSLPDGLEAVFQPIINLREGRIAGFEALARWRGADGQLSSAHDMPGGAAELIAAHVAGTMLRQSAEALYHWRRESLSPTLFVQVNLTGTDLYRADVFTDVQSVIREFELPMGALKVELTEQAALRDFHASIAAASALKAAGAGLVLDDFGSGHSSFAWLAGLPADGLKLDPQLTQMAGSRRVDTVLAGVTRLARDLGMTVTAEGVEDMNRVAFLKEIGCDYVQGFAYARPMDRTDADKLVMSELA